MALIYANDVCAEGMMEHLAHGTVKRKETGTESEHFPRKSWKHLCKRWV